MTEARSTGNLLVDENKCLRDGLCAAECPAGIIQMFVGLPAGYHHFPMMLGYPVPRYFRLPNRKAPQIIWK